MSISSNINNLSSDSSQMMTITVAATNQQFMRLHTLSVPLNRLSSAIRNIHRSGGKVLNMSAQAIGAAATHNKPAASPTRADAETIKPNNGSKKKKK